MTKRSTSPYQAILAAVFLFMPLWVAYGQDNDDAAESLQSPTNTFYLTCEEPQPYKAHTATSAVLVSPDFSYRAFTHASVNTECANESKIFVRGPRDGAYRQLFAQEPKR